MNRRVFLLTGGAAMLLGACNNAVGTGGEQQLEARVDATRDYLLRTYPATGPVIQNARGVLYMPTMTEASFGLGGGYGEGALRINGKTVDYYSATRASIGLQAGAQRYAHALIFQTDQALAAFRQSPGWVAGADIYYALPTAGGGAAGSDTITAQYPVLAYVFGQSGLVAGASVAGTKYTRVVPSAF